MDVKEPPSPLRSLAIDCLKVVLDFTSSTQLCRLWLCGNTLMMRNLEHSTRQMNIKLPLSSAGAHSLPATFISRFSKLELLSVKLLGNDCIAHGNLAVLPPTLRSLELFSASAWTLFMLHPDKPVDSPIDLLSWTPPGDTEPFNLHAQCPLLERLVVWNPQHGLSPSVRQDGRDEQQWIQASTDNYVVNNKIVAAFPASITSFILPLNVSLTNEGLCQLPKSLRALTVKNWTNVTAAFFPSLPKSLQELTLQVTCREDDVLSQLPSSLHTLKLANRWTKPLDFTQLPRQLTSLNLEDSVAPYSSILPDTLDVRKLPSKLTSLTVGIHFLDKDEQCGLLPQSLTHLSLGFLSVTITDQGIQLLPSSLLSLKVLCYTNSAAGSVLLEGTLYPALPRKLQSLHWGPCVHFTGHKFYELPAGLKTLILPYAKISNEHIRDLPRSLIHLSAPISTLSSLYLIDLPPTLRRLEQADGAFNQAFSALLRKKLSLRPFQLQSFGSSPAPEDPDAASSCTTM